MSTPTLTIRPASVDDVLPLRDLSRSTFYETYAAYNTDDDIRRYMQEHFGIEQLKADIQDPRNTYFIALLQDQMIGYAKLRRQINEQQTGSLGTIEIERIYVSKAFQKQRAGAALMQHCIDTAIREHYPSIWLGVWEKNPKAIAFYEKWGFSVTGTHTFMFGTDPQNDLVMTRPL